MTTKLVRVPTSTHGEVHLASRLLGLNPSELLHAAWEAYRETPEFANSLEVAQRAFSSGALEKIEEALRVESERRATLRAESSRPSGQ